MMLRSKRDRVSPPLNNHVKDLKRTKPVAHERLREEAAAIMLQKNIRGFMARKKYGIKQLNRYQMEHYPAFVVGNDPKIPKSLSDFHVADEKIALVATSGVRAIAIACQLGNRQQTPKIFLIDNSREVCDFWLALRTFAGDDALAPTAAKFLGNLPGFLRRHDHLYRDIPDHALSHRALAGVKYPNQNIGHFFEKLMTQYGYEYVRAVLTHSSILKQSWEDTDTFVKVKNILSHQGIKKIFMYPSNIVGCVEAEIGNGLEVNRILANIEKLAPVLSIHTDCCSRHGHPEKVYLLQNQEPKKVMSTLFAPNGCTSQGFSGNAGMSGVIRITNTEDLMMLLQMLNGRGNARGFRMNL